MVAVVVDVVKVVTFFRVLGVVTEKVERLAFPGISGCIFAPCTGGPGESSCQGSEYVWQRGVGSKKCLVMGQSLFYSGGLIESCQ